MFSYGMVLYELLSGQRPALGHHQLQIAKKLSKGIRPVLGQPEEVQFHRLQALMMECWDTKPEKVHGRVEPGPFFPGGRGCGCVPARPPSLRTAGKSSLSLLDRAFVPLMYLPVLVCVHRPAPACLSAERLPFSP